MMRVLLWLLAITLKDKRVVCLGIPDNYDFMQVQQIRLPEGLAALSEHMRSTDAQG